MEEKTNYELYLECFCESHHMTHEEAEQLAIVQEVKKSFEEEGYDE